MFPVQTKITRKGSGDVTVPFCRSMLFLHSGRRRAVVRAVLLHHCADLLAVHRERPFGRQSDVSGERGQDAGCMSPFAFATRSPGVDPATRAAGVSELDTALALLDDLVSALTGLRDACSWESEGVAELRRRLWGLSDRAVQVRSMLQSCRTEAEGA